MKKAVCALALLLMVCLVVAPTAAQPPPPVSVGLGLSQPLPIGQSSTINVTVTDVANSTVQLVFVGLQWEWDARSTFYVGQNSDKGAVLSSGEQITYIIGVPVPDNVSQGTHKLSTFVAYRWFTRGNWTGTLEAWWVTGVQLAFPQAQSQTATVQGPQATSNLQAIAVLIAVVAIGLYLERGRIRRVVQKHQEASPEPAKSESAKAPGEENKEQDL